MFEREKITLAIGDRIRFSKNVKHRGQKFLNNELRTEVSIDDGKIIFGVSLVPSNSIACMCLACGSEAALIWKLSREIPYRVSLIEIIFSATLSGSLISNAPFGRRSASNDAERRWASHAPFPCWRESLHSL